MEEDLMNWKVLVADDDLSIHGMIEMILEGLELDGFPVEILHAYSETETLNILDKQKDIAIILLDMVMENVDSGTRIAQAIRKDRKLDCMRIVLLTAKPEQVPVEETILNCDINDFRDKRLVDIMAMKILVIANIRAYRDLRLIRDQKDQLAKLQEDRHLEVLGTLAGGLAHDINNVLGGVTGAVSLLELELSETGKTDTVKEYLDAIKASTKQASGILQQMLVFTREHSTVLQNIELVSLIRDFLENKGAILPPGIRLAGDFSVESAVIKGNSFQIETVLSNLFDNAVQAIRATGKESGEISVSLSAYQGLDNNIVQGSQNENKAYFALKIEDTGIGLDPSLKKQIFSPFYSTWNQKAGAGIGLAMINAIVKSHSGAIAIKEGRSGGMCFVVYLPAGLNKKKGSEIRERKTDVTAFASKGEKILFCDDEEIMRKMGKKILTSLGYLPFIASGGQEALDILAENKDIGLVLIDIMMPLMDGLAVVSKIRENDQKIKIVITSGFGELEYLRAAKEMGVTVFLQKPYTLEDVKDALSSV
jgi:signal transduction histidine kinase